MAVPRIGRGRLAIKAGDREDEPNAVTASEFVGVQKVMQS